MSQSNYNIPNQSAPNVRAQLNAVFGSIATNNSGSTAPSTTFAYQWWYDTSTSLLKMRNAANSAWINIARFDQSGGVFQLLDDTPIVTTSGTAAGLLGDQATATWVAGTSTTESLVSPAKVKAAVEALATVNTSTVLAAIAGASVGGVGTYIVAWNATTTEVAVGGTLAGSSLRYQTGFVGLSSPFTAKGGSSFGTTATAALSGTWRAIVHGGGRFEFQSDPAQFTWPPSLWLRIS